MMVSRLHIPFEPLLIFLCNLRETENNFLNSSEASNNEFRKFALTCDSIRATRSKLEKVRLLSQYLITLTDDNDLKIAVTFLSGRVFPPGEVEREANVGYSTLWKVIGEITNSKDTELSLYYRKHGDLGSALEDAVADKMLSNSKNGSRQIVHTLFQKTLSLQEVYNSFVQLSKSVGPHSQERKEQILRGLFSNVIVPSEAKYIVKILTNEMRIGLVEGLLEESIAKAYSKATTEIRLANLIEANLGLVAIQARRGELEHSKLTPLRPTNFMLADTAETAELLFQKFKSPPMYSEYKYDGIRAQFHKLGDEVRFFSRNLANVTRFFPELEKGAKEIQTKSLILDGEIIAFSDGKPLSFQLLQRRLRKINHSAEDAPVKYMAFDVLFCNNNSLIRSPLKERVQVLRALNLPEPPMGFSDQRLVSSAQEISDMFVQSKTIGYEGLVVKDPLSPYAPGRRGSNWVKLKKELDTLDVVVVAAEYGHGKRAGVISDYTFAVRDGQDLKVVGKAYSGLTDAEIAEMTEIMKNTTVQDQGYRRVVKPQVVLEVAFDAIQKSDRHNSGFALRFPRIKRIRYDKSVPDIDDIEKVRKIYQEQKVKI
jgi:DNA ligase-1